MARAKNRSTGRDDLDDACLLYPALYTSRAHQCENLRSTPQSGLMKRLPLVL